MSLLRPRDIRGSHEREAIIYRPARSATQSGTRRQPWVLEFVPSRPHRIDVLMGWAGGGDTQVQARLRFPDRQAAERFARTQRLSYVVLDEARRSPRPKSYAENFLRPRPAAG